ncbi:hypothetical protein MUG87_14430 [Ectobacillus sp. JY-23]|uniref:hypothetical protein n=1 Tax=Ectobacillus sp. JY-23 TaxID=2933872 RepID=UPI001FF5B55B|nr:hypothetical protein [Ectobacillus sp. JY-23]UOY91679.1 hypothetical protein MUG87_14430 [Ectobacillus sp. JY-23]
MESVIVTYLSGRGGEIDIELFNGASAGQVIEELYELDGIQYEWRNEMHYLEYSVDGKEWSRLSKKEVLAAAGVWDGMYLRLHAGQGAFTPKPFSQKQPTSTPRVSPEPEEKKEYVWTLLE